MQVPPKQRYPFYGSIHWYVVQRYTEALSWLRGAGNAVEEVGAENGQTMQSSGQWLKHISMKRVCTVSSKGKVECSKKQSDEEVSASSDAALESVPVLSAVQDSARAFQDSVRAQDSTRDPHNNSTAVHDVTTVFQDSSIDDQDISRTLQDNSTSDQGTLMEIGIQDTPACLQDNHTMTTVQDSQTVLQDSMRAMMTAAKKPHFSSHERGGLLLLVHKMKNALFEKDVPSSLPSPQDLVLELEELLQSSLSDQVCSLEPSGVGVVSSRHTPSKSATPSRAGARKRNSAVVCQESDCMAKRERTASVTVERVTDTATAQCNSDPPSEVKKSPAPTTDTTSDTSVSTRHFTPITSHTLHNFQPIPSTATPTPLMTTPTSTAATLTSVAPRPLTPGVISSGPVPITSALTLVPPLTDCQATLGVGWVYTRPLSALPAGVLEDEFAEVSITRIPNPAYSSQAIQ